MDRGTRRILEFVVMTPTSFFLNMAPKVRPLVLRLGLSLTYFEMNYKNIIAIFFRKL